MFTFAPLGPIDMLGPLLLQLIRTPGRIFVLLRQYKPIIFANLLANLMKIRPKHKDFSQNPWLFNEKCVGGLVFCRKNVSFAPNLYKNHSKL